MRTVVDVYYDGDGQATKADARYTPKGTSAEHCGICAHFHRPNACDRVQGLVVPDGWCRFFLRKDK